MRQDNQFGLNIMQAVAKNIATSRVTNSLWTVHAEAKDVPNLQAEWDTLNVHTKISSSTDWSHLLADYWPEVKQAFERIGFTGEQYEPFLKTLGAWEFLTGDLPYDPDFDIT
jgi:hypothetical protein